MRTRSVIRRIRSSKEKEGGREGGRVGMEQACIGDAPLFGFRIKWRKGGRKRQGG